MINTIYANNLRRPACDPSIKARGNLTERTLVTHLSDRLMWGAGSDHALSGEHFDAAGASTGVYFAMGDHLGSVTEVVGSTGLIESRRFDAFGNVKQTAGPGALPATLAAIWGYTARYSDPVTTLQSNRARWYDPKTGRFISEDPIGFSGGDSNLYAYVGNSPLTHTDPTGHRKGFSPYLKRIRNMRAEQMRAIHEAEKGDDDDGFGWFGDVFGEDFAGFVIDDVWDDVLGVDKNKTFGISNHTFVGSTMGGIFQSPVKLATASSWEDVMAAEFNVLWYGTGAGYVVEQSGVNSGSFTVGLGVAVSATYVYDPVTGDKTLVYGVGVGVGAGVGVFAGVQVGMTQRANGDIEHTLGASAGVYAGPVSVGVGATWNIERPRASSVMLFAATGPAHASVGINGEGDLIGGFGVSASFSMAVGGGEAARTDSYAAGSASAGVGYSWSFDGEGNIRANGFSVSGGYTPPRPEGSGLRKLSEKLGHIPKKSAQNQNQNQDQNQSQTPRNIWDIPMSDVFLSYDAHRGGFSSPLLESLTDLGTLIFGGSGASSRSGGLNLNFESQAAQLLLDGGYAPGLELGASPAPAPTQTVANPMAGQGGGPPPWLSAILAGYLTDDLTPVSDTRRISDSDTTPPGYYVMRPEAQPFLRPEDFASHIAASNAPNVPESFYSPGRNVFSTGQSLSRGGQIVDTSWWGMTKAVAGGFFEGFMEFPRSTPGRISIETASTILMPWRKVGMSLGARALNATIQSAKFAGVHEVYGATIVGESPSAQRFAINTGIGVGLFGAFESLVIAGRTLAPVGRSMGAEIGVFLDEALSPVLTMAPMRSALGLQIGQQGFGAHVVPVGNFSSRATIVQRSITDAKAVLSRNGIDLDSWYNGFVAFERTHGSTHKDAFLKQLGPRLERAEGLGGRNAVLNELNNLKLEVLSGQ